MVLHCIRTINWLRCQRCEVTTKTTTATLQINFLWLLCTNAVIWPCLIDSSESPIRFVVRDTNAGPETRCSRVTAPAVCKVYLKNLVFFRGRDRALFPIHLRGSPVSSYIAPNYEICALDLAVRWMYGTYGQIILGWNEAEDYWKMKVFFTHEEKRNVSAWAKNGLP